MKKILVTTLLLVLLAGIFCGSGQALIRGGRNMIPNQEDERAADILYEMYDRAEKRPHYSKRGNYRILYFVF